MFPAIFLAAMFLGLAGGALLFEDEKSDKKKLPVKKEKRNLPEYKPDLNNIVTPFHHKNTELFRDKNNYFIENYVKCISATKLQIFSLKTMGQ